MGGRYADAGAAQLRRVVVFRDALYVVGGSTEYGASHASRGSAIVERFDPGR